MPPSLSVCGEAAQRDASDLCGFPDWGWHDRLAQVKRVLTAFQDVIAGDRLAALRWVPLAAPAISQAMRITAY